MDVSLAASVVLVPEIAAVPAVVVAIKQVNTVVQITEERVQMWTTALHSTESACVSSVIKPVALSLLGVMALTQKKRNLSNQN